MIRWPLVHDWAPHFKLDRIWNKECSNYCTIVLMSHTSKVMLKILQARLQQYMNCELPDVQSGFRKGRGTKDQIASICWIIKKTRVPEKHLLLLSVQFNHTVMYDSVTPWTAACQASLSITNSCSLLNSCPLSWWCHPTISSSVVPFSSCLQSFPASGSFQMNQFFASGSQSIGSSASTSVFPMNIQDWFPLRWTG